MAGRFFLCWATMLLCGIFPVTPAAQILSVTLLGSGMPQPQIERFGPSVLVEAGGQTLLFDAGRGTAQRIYQLYIPFPEVTRIFITHLHYDHLIGLPDLLLSGWEFRRSDPLQVWGPPGIAAHLDHLAQAYRVDIQQRKNYSRLSSTGITYQAHEISDGIIYAQNGLTVTAFSVDHRPLQYAFGFLIEYAGRSVVISGDTRYSSAVLKHATGADLLIHEIAAASASLLTANPRLQNILNYHTSPEDLAVILAAARPRLAVLTHQIVFGLSTEELLRRVSRGHEIQVRAGHDLMAFDIGETIVEYQRPR